jgi:predicted PhzF superfamily epimerase YddE/YHI9
VGIPADPVTGAAHTQLVPLRTERLGGTHLVCRRASAGSGVLVCDLAGQRVRMGGRAVLHAKGEIVTPL